jgi:hypothetical protein
MNEKNLPKSQDEPLTDSTYGLPPELNEALQNIPEEKRNIIIREYHSVTMGMMRSEKTTEESIISKMTSKNMDTYMKDAGDNMRLTHKGKTQNRVFLFGLALIITILFIVVIVIFRDNPEFIEKIIMPAGGVLAGFAGGFGFGKSKRDE